MTEHVQIHVRNCSTMKSAISVAIKDRVSIKTHLRSYKYSNKAFGNLGCRYIIEECYFFEQEILN